MILYGENSSKFCIAFSKVLITDLRKLTHVDLLVNDVLLAFTAASMQSFECHVIDTLFYRL